MINSSHSFFVYKKKLLNFGHDLFIIYSDYGRFEKEKYDRDRQRNCIF